MKKEKFVGKTYRLKRDVAPLCFMLPSRNTPRFPLLWFDEETGVNREMRYARNQKSIFVDEQDGNALLEPIVFEDGFLHVPKNQQLLQKFLSHHPLMGVKFEEVNNEVDATEQVEKLNIEVDALIAARELSIDQIETISRVLFGKDTSKITTAELKRDMLVFARTEPETFLNILGDPMLKFQARVQEFFDAGVLIQKTKGTIHFNTKSNKKRMLTIPVGEDRNLMVAHYLQSDDGIEDLKLLEKTFEAIE